MTFEIFLDIVESSRQVSWVDYEEETTFTKGVINFGYDGRRFRAIFSHNFLEVMAEY